MPCYHLHADRDGETHLTEWVLPTVETSVGSVEAVGEIPTLTAGIAGFFDRKPDAGLHEAPRRQFILVLRGVLEIETSLGERHELNAGDVMLADDVGSKGHFSRDVGDRPLMMMTVGIEGSWEGPGRQETPVSR
jgi:hypothetical protein